MNFPSFELHLLYFIYFIVDQRNLMMYLNQFILLNDQLSKIIYLLFYRSFYYISIIIKVNFILKDFWFYDFHIRTNLDR
jgi:hypothetical protein